MVLDISYLKEGNVFGLGKDYVFSNPNSSIMKALAYHGCNNNS